MSLTKTTGARKSRQEMALAREILAFLPLWRFAELYPDPPEDLLRQRLTTVNRIPEERMRRRASFLALPWGRRHLWLSSFQGELSPAASDFVGQNELCLRAAYLRDEAAYLYFAARRTLPRTYPDRIPPLEAQWVFQSGNPRMVAAFLAGMQGESFVLPDLVSIPWTESLRKMVRHFLHSPKLPSHLAPLGGYVQLAPLQSRPADYYALEYAIGLLWNNCELSPEDWRFLEQIAKGSLNCTLAEFLADYGFLIPETERDYPALARRALGSFQPALLRQIPLSAILQVSATVKPWRHAAIRFITFDLLRRVKAMQEQIQERGIPVTETYAACMQVLLGQDFQCTPEILDALGWLPRAVCHPSLTESDLRRTLYLGRSMVHYNMPHMIATRTRALMTSVDDGLPTIYMRGLYFSALDSSFPLWSPQKASNPTPDFQQRYQELLAAQ